MATQPCDKCGISVDPELQEDCPNCGRRIRAAAPPPPTPPRPQESQVDYSTAGIPPPPPSFPPGGIPSEPTSGSRPARLLVALLVFGGIIAATVAGAVSSNEGTEIATDIEDFLVVDDQGSVSIHEVGVGDCLSDPGADSFLNIEVVPCAVAHDFEVFTIHQITSADSYPSGEEFETIVFDSCLPEFERYTGEDYQTSDLYIGYFIPDVAGWKRGDRAMQCYLYLPDGPITGSRAAG